MHVDKVNQLKDRQRVQLTEVAHDLGISLSVTEQLAKKLELEVEQGCGLEGLSCGKAGRLNTSEVATEKELRSAFAGCTKGGGSRGVEAALMKSRVCAADGRSSGTAASVPESSRTSTSSGRRTESEGARGSCMSGLSAIRGAISNRASQRMAPSKGGTHKMVLGSKRHTSCASKRSPQVAPGDLPDGGSGLGSPGATDAVQPLSHQGEAGGGGGLNTHHGRISKQ